MKIEPILVKMAIFGQTKRPAKTPFLRGPNSPEKLLFLSNFDQNLGIFGIYGLPESRFFVKNRSPGVFGPQNVLILAQNGHFGACKRINRKSPAGGAVRARCKKVPCLGAILHPILDPPKPI